MVTIVCASRDVKIVMVEQLAKPTSSYSPELDREKSYRRIPILLFLFHSPAGVRMMQHQQVSLRNLLSLCSSLEARLSANVGHFRHQVLPMLAELGCELR